MRRFVTYLYEYEKGNRGKNCGFVRVDVRGGEVQMEVHLRNCLRCGEKGIIYILVKHDEEIFGVEAAEISIFNGRGERAIQFEEGNIQGSGYTFEQIAGIGILCENGGYLASNWHDEDYEVLTNGNFRILRNSDTQIVVDRGKPILSLTDWKDEKREVNSELTKKKDSILSMENSFEVEEKFPVAQEILTPINLQEKADEMQQTSAGIMESVGAMKLRKEVDEVQQASAGIMQDSMESVGTMKLQREVDKMQQASTEIMEDSMEAVGAMKLQKEVDKMQQTSTEIMQDFMELEERNGIEISGNLEIGREKEPLWETQICADFQQTRSCEPPVLLQSECESRNLFSEMEPISQKKTLSWREQLDAMKQADIFANPPKQSVVCENEISNNNKTWFFEKEDVPKVKVCSYKKIAVSDIRNLPSANWYLCNNNFLLHGFFNYNYLIMKKESMEGKEKFYLGVPGVFEKQEKVMAMMFGFPYFESCSEEELNIEGEFEQVEKEREPKEGAFGCWYLLLNI